MLLDGESYWVLGEIIMKLRSKILFMVFISGMSVVYADQQDHFIKLDSAFENQELSDQTLEHAKLFIEKAQAAGWNQAEIAQALLVSADIMRASHHQQTSAQAPDNHQLDVFAELLKYETGTLKVLKYFNILASLTSIITTAALIALLIR